MTSEVFEHQISKSTITYFSLRGFVRTVYSMCAKILTIITKNSIAATAAQIELSIALFRF